MFLRRRTTLTRLVSALTLLISVVGAGLWGPSPAQAAIATRVSIVVVTPVLPSSTGTTTVYGYLRSGSRRLTNGRIVIRAYGADSGQFRLTTTSITDATGRYRLVLKAGVSLRLTASFLGSQSYAPSTSPSEGITVDASAPSGSPSSSIPPQADVGPMITIMCDQYGKLISRAGGPAVGTTGGVILGATGEQVSDQCTGKDPKVLQSYLNQLKGVATGFAASKVLGATATDVIGRLVDFHRALGLTMKSSSADVWRAYKLYAMDAYNSVSSIIESCLRLPRLIDSANCTRTIGASLDRLYAVTFLI